MGQGPNPQGMDPLTTGSKAAFSYPSFQLHSTLQSLGPNSIPHDRNRTMLLLPTELPKSHLTAQAQTTCQSIVTTTVSCIQ